MIKKWLLLLLIILSLSTYASAQNVNGVMPIDGAGMSSGIKSNPGSNIVNVDLYTGIGTVTVPILNYQHEGLDLGISLSYNTKGIQVDQIASSVGLGWNLNAGGEILRTVNALEDELYINRTDNQYSGLLYKGSWTGNTGAQYLDEEYDVLNINFGGRSLELLWTFHDSNKIITYPKSEISFRTILTNDSVESYYDDYTTGAFIPGISNACGGSLNTTNEMSFYIIDEKGNQFFFRPGDVEHKKFDIPESDFTKRKAATRWILTKILTNNGSEVIYNYRKKYLSYTSSKIEKVTEYFATNGVTPPSFSYSSEDYVWSGYVSQLTSIDYPNGQKAIFHWDTSSNGRCDLPGGFVVDSITIESGFDLNYKNSITYRFNYSYFHTPNFTNSSTNIAHRTPCYNIESNGQFSGLASITSRLKLNSIDRVGKDHVHSEPYFIFEYHTVPLPNRLSFSKDYYGFFNNGQTSIAGHYYAGVPYHVYNNNNGFIDTLGTDRTPDATSNLEYIQAGLLKKITNGLGGITELEYAKPDITNSACGYQSLTYFHGFTNASGQGPGCTIDPELEGQNATDGLVISTIQLHDGFSLEHSKRMVYTYSGGERFFRGGYFWIPLQVYGDVVKKREYSNHMVSPHSYIRGSNHGFSSVIVSTENYLTTEQLSKTKYEFSNLFLPNPLTELFTSAFVDSVAADYTKHYFLAGPKPVAGMSCIKQETGPQYHTMPPSVMEKFLMGLLRSEIEYDQNNNVVSEVINRYDLNFHNIATGKIQQRNYHTRKFYYERVNDTFLSPINTYEWLSLLSPVVNAEPRIRYSRSTKHSGGRSLFTEYNYEYDYADNLKCTKWIDSKGNINEKQNFYTYDYGLYDTMLYTSLQYLLTERLLKAHPYSPTIKKVLSQSVVKPSISAQNVVYPSVLSQVFGGGVWYLSRLITTQDSAYIPRLASKKYLPRIHFKSVYASSIQDPLTLTQASNDATSALAGSTSIGSLKMVKQYTQYDEHNNVLEVKLNELDKYNSYVWDSRYGYKVAEVENAQFNQIAYTSFEGLNNPVACQTDNGNWIFNPAAVKYVPSSISYNDAITGKYIMDLNISDVSAHLQQNTEYILSFWSDITPKVYLGSTQLTPQITHILPYWKLYTIKFNSSNASIIRVEDNSTLSSVGFIDEVRLHPANATMTTYTYEPLFGVSSVCDPRNNILYTEYDAQGRATIIRDINKFIRTKSETRNQVNSN